MYLFTVLAAEGYARFERLLPSGIQFPSGQVTSRFRPTAPGRDSPLYQSGQGIFTANALPPYESWQKFSPYVQKGIECLMTAHDRAGIPKPNFRAALIRYIDAFPPSLTGGASLQDFLRDVMQIDISLPDIIRSRVTEEHTIEPVIKLAAQTSIGRMELVFSEGPVGNERAVMADMSVLMLREIGSDVAAAMQVLSDGRQLIHDLFRGLTAPLHNMMEPIA
jgi:uncharacterized protein (TIGR04255 family)